MDLYVVLAGFGPSHHQLGFEVTPLVWFPQSELLLIKPSSHTVTTVVSVAPLTDTDHSGPEHTHMCKDTGTLMQTRESLGTSRIQRILCH